MNPLFLRLSIRHFLRHPWQMVLSILGIAVGIAMMIAVELSTTSSLRAFELSIEAVTGKATHQLTGGPAGIPERLFAELKTRAPQSYFAPVVDGFVVTRNQTLRLLGIDPFSEKQFRNSIPQGNQSTEFISAFITKPGAVVVTQKTADDLGLHLGKSFSVKTGSRKVLLTLVATINSASPGLEHVFLSDISTAQETLDLVGKLSRIDVITSDQDLQLILKTLPPHLKLQGVGRHNSHVESITQAFRTNLKALSFLSLFVGMFLIYNTMTFSVVQRRSLLGMLRALGVQRAELFTLILIEAFLLGIIGIALGCVLGVFLAQVLLKLVTQSINDLYFVLHVQSLYLSIETFIKALLLGICTTLGAAFFPALEALRSPPQAAIQRSNVETKTRRLLHWLTALSFLFFAIGYPLLKVEPLWFNFAGISFLLLGAAFLAPSIAILLSKIFHPFLKGAFGSLGSLSTGIILKSSSRSAVAIAALLVAVSVANGMGIMVSSFRNAVKDWLDYTLPADVYVSPAVITASRTDYIIPQNVVHKIRSAPFVEGVSTNRRMELDTSIGPSQVTVLDIHPLGKDSVRLIEGNMSQAWERWHQERVVFVSEPYSRHRHVRIGSKIKFMTDQGEKDFEVIGIYRDYAADQGIVMISRKVFSQNWNDSAISAFAIYLEKNVKTQEAIRKINALIPADIELQVRSNTELKTASLEIFDRTFTVTSVLRYLALLVAGIGVLSSLMALQLEKGRETALLRAIGLTPAQVWMLSGLQNVLIGFISGILAIPAGLGLGWVLTTIINGKSFGWTIPLSWEPSVFLQSILYAVIAAFLAGVYPSLKAATTRPGLALRDEG